MKPYVHLQRGESALGTAPKIRLDPTGQGVLQKMSGKAGFELRDVVKPLGVERQDRWRQDRYRRVSSAFETEFGGVKEPRVWVEWGWLRRVCSPRIKDVLSKVKQKASPKVFSEWSDSFATRPYRTRFEEIRYR